ncbi:MAG: hypothetical protein M3Y27_24685 [Acidobacteriota bacterium]|nr:hypothetical protein [Acidobacteriota bacterium]
MKVVSSQAFVNRKLTPQCHIKSVEIEASQRIAPQSPLHTSHRRRESSFVQGASPGTR